MSNLILLTVRTCIFECVVLPKYVTVDKSLSVYTTYPVSLLVVSVHLQDIVFLFPASATEDPCGASPYLRTMDASRQTDNHHKK
jgi:hypothetical protein